ncbi:MAG TPA: radical SAM-associated putative lipoprotein [Prolixibacteraceae bacterium]|nr:radical SAM-associated putative lipoprotein [Prolixibacteraceae bacterium]
MVAIKRKFFQSVNSMIVFLISLLGFTVSCEVEAEYGTPHADFIIHGKITSVADSKPIPEIIVEMRYVDEEASYQSGLMATGFSHHTTGSYDVSSRTNPDDQTFRLRFIDTDGPKNGEYETLDTTVVFQDPKFVKGDGSWYRGYVTKELDIKLKPKE